MSSDADRKASIARAEALFASLTEEAEQKRVGARSEPAIPREAPADPSPLTDGEVRDLFVAARAATERTANVVKTVRSQANATAADLTVIGEAIEDALAATNDRLVSIERGLPDEGTPDEEAVERAGQAMDRLGRTLRRARRRNASGPAT